MRKPLIIANWKMNKNVDEALTFVKKVKGKLPNASKVEVGIAPQAFALYPMKQAVGNANLKIIGQNAAAKYEGAYTGEISVRGLADMGLQYVMLGHLERRRYFNETNAIVHEKVLAAMNAGVTPIICTDEEMTQTEINGEIHYVFRQLMDVLADIPSERVKKIVLSYEPSWAVGFGQHANPMLAEAGCRQIRRTIADIYSYEVADKIRILYGGSVNPENINEIMGKPDIDGALIGRASLDPAKFVKMINYDSKKMVVPRPAQVVGVK